MSFRGTRDAFVAVCGLAVVTTIVLELVSAHLGLPLLLVAGAVAGGAAGKVSARLCGSYWPAGIAAVVLLPVLPWASSRLLITPVSYLAPVTFGLGVFTLALVSLCAPRRRVLGAAAVGALLVGTTALPAGAWSVDEPPKDDPKMVAGNGIVLGADTHAFLLARGVAILEGDGHTRVADFLNSPDPTAPARRDQSTGKPTAQQESYLWRMQLGSRDADRKNKPEMPDHFFNWWTHSGKGLVAGRGAADYAEQQYGQAVKLWKKGDHPGAMYHLGAATHLVQDGCTPPHASFLVPEHRAYEDWVMTQQKEMKTTSGGIYRDQFRVTTGHGGKEWSSSHTRGWVDECAHRAAQLIPNVVRPPTTSLTPGDVDKTSIKHLRETKQITAGYLAFFFDEVGGP